MRIIALHSRYRVRGGEDESFDTEVELLRRLGHQVTRFVRSGADLADGHLLRRAGTAVWNAEVAAGLADRIRSDRPDVAYCNNYFPALGPAALRTLFRMRVPTVLAVRNYRLACVSGLLFRDGARCQDCTGLRVPTPGVRHACHPDGRLASAGAGAAQVLVRRALDDGAEGTWFAAVSPHVRRFLLNIGIPADRVRVKPNTTDGVPAPTWSAGSHLLYVGRLEEEKGVRLALRAVGAVPGAHLVVVGEGRLEDEVRRAAGTGRVTFAGRRSRAEVLRLMSGARATIVPSLWDEPFGRVAMESLACGTPVVVSDRGGLGDIAADGVSGLVVSAGNAEAWSAAVGRVLRERWWAAGARRAAHDRFQDRFSPAVVGATIEAILAAAAGSPLHRVQP